MWIEIVDLWCRERYGLGAKCAGFRRTQRRISESEDSVSERGGFEPPRPFKIRWAEIPSEFGSPFRRQKSIRAGENLVALGSSLLQISAVLLKSELLSGIESKFADLMLG